MLGWIMRQILGILWEIIFAAIVGFLWAAILATILYPIAAIGQVAHEVFSSHQGSYNTGTIDGVPGRAALGVLVLLVLWIGAYLLFGRVGLLIVGGITLFVAILGWFNRLVVPAGD